MLATDPARWLPWPSKAVALDQHVMQQLATSGSELVALLGHSQAGAHGRFGFVGIPAASGEIAAGNGVIARTIDQHPRDGIRVVLFGYELGAPDVLLPSAASPRQQPAGWVADLQTVLIVDHRQHTYAMISWRDDPTAQQHWDQLCAAINAPGLVESKEHWLQECQLRPLITDAEHAERIGRVQEAIAAGDIYQANVTRRLVLEPSLHQHDHSPHARVAGAMVLSALAAANPVSHNAMLRFGQHEIISNSMETLITYAPATRTLRTYPIKGTCARTGDHERDRIAQDRLSTHAKERAEHVMIVDLLRNDLGKVAVPGSVHVPELMAICGYHGVFHGISTIEATLSPEHTLGDAMAAVFPGGSITGAPKRRAMQIIADIEQEPRGFYTGSIGIVLPDGSFSASILIRTLVTDRQCTSLSVGGGIVAESDPAREVNETWEKIAVFQHVFKGHRCVLSSSPRRRGSRKNA